MATCGKIREELQKSSSDLRCSQDVTEVLGMLQTSRLGYHGSDMQETPGGDRKAAGDGGKLFKSFSPGL